MEKKNEIYYQEILQQIKKNDLENYVYFTGWLSNSSIFYKNIDIYVLASRHDEGFGLVVAEAMMHNLPVVATKSGGVIEIIEDGKSGLLVPKNNPERLSKAICNLLNDYELRNKISYNSKVRILKNFDIQIQREKFLLLLTQ